MGPFAILALGLFFVFTAFGQNRVVTSGVVELVAGQRYRLQVFVPATMATPAALASVVDSFQSTGAISSTVSKVTREGTYLALVARAPSAVSVTIGQELVPGTRLVSVERLGS